LNEASTTTQSRSLISFFTLAFLFSWSIGVPLALAHQGIIPRLLPDSAHYLVAYGPMLSALVLTGFTQRMPGLKDLGRRMLRWACPKWWFIAFSPLLLGYGALLIQNLFSAEKLRFWTLGSVNFLGELGVFALPFWIFTFGFGEETGWRGYALPVLQEKRSAFSATMILAGFWALWHLPQFFYVFEFSITAIGWLVGLFAGAVFLTWFYNSTGNSILMVAVWHGCFNFVSASAAETGMLPFVISALVIFFAITILRRTDPHTMVSI
jgi:membrane protease YdiL (CAAX protease family)